MEEIVTTPPPELPDNRVRLPADYPFKEGQEYPEEDFVIVTPPPATPTPAPPAPPAPPAAE